MSIIQNQKTPALPFRGEIVDAARIAVLKRVKFKLPEKPIERIQEATRKIRSIIAQQGALTLEGARTVHSASREAVVQSIVSDVEPSTRLAHIETVTRELEEKRQALVQAQGRIFVGVIGDIETVGAAIVDGLSTLAELIEEEERVSANDFSIAFEASPQLRLVQSVTILARRRFDGIRTTIERSPTLLGTPGSLFVDLLPGVADW